MKTPADESVFEDTKITENDLIGQHEYPNVLYSGSKLKRAKEYAREVEKTSFDYPCVAVNPNPEGPYRNGVGADVFFNHSLTGLEWHKVFKKAIDSDAYIVNHYPNYSTGTLTIKVKKRK